MAQWNESREGMEKKIADFELKRKDRNASSLEVMLTRGQRD